MQRPLALHIGPARDSLWIPKPSNMPTRKPAARASSGPRRAKTKHRYDPVGMAGKKAGIVKKMSKAKGTSTRPDSSSSGTKAE